MPIAFPLFIYSTAFSPAKCCPIFFSIMLGFVFERTPLMPSFLAVSNTVAGFSVAFKPCGLGTSTPSGGGILLTGSFLVLTSSVFPRMLVFSGCGSRVSVLVFGASVFSAVLSCFPVGEFCPKLLSSRLFTLLFDEFTSFVGANNNPFSDCTLSNDSSEIALS